MKIDDPMQHFTRLLRSVGDRRSEEALRAWQGQGLIPSPRLERRPGYRTGFAAFYPDDIDAHVLAAAELVTRYKYVYKAVLALWTQGFAVETEHLRVAALQVTSQTLTVATKKSDDPETIAQHVANTLYKRDHGKRWRHNQDGKRRTNDNTHWYRYRHAVDGGVGIALTGRVPSEQDASELLTQSGLADLLATLCELMQLTAVVPHIGDVAEFLPACSIGSIQEAVATATRIDFEDARRLGQLLTTPESRFRDELNDPLQLAVAMLPLLGFMPIVRELIPKLESVIATQPAA